MNKQEIAKGYLIALGLLVATKWKTQLPRMPKLKFAVSFRRATATAMLSIWAENDASVILYSMQGVLAPETERLCINEQKTSGSAMVLPTGNSKEDSLARAISRSDLSDHICMTIVQKIVGGAK